MKKLIIATFLSFQALLMSAQYSTSGTDFWVSFMQNFDNPANCILYITSNVASTGTVSMPGTGWSQNFTIVANGSATIQVPDAQGPAIATPNAVINKGIRIVSNNPIAVYAANQRTASSDATLVLPVVALGDEYRVMSYSVLSGQPSQFVVCGIQNATSIQITPTAAVTGGVGAGVPFNITLNAGQVYLVQSAGDLTGTVIRATDINNCNNFAVFSGNRCANVPTSCTYCDHLYEQALPIKAWGNNYATAPLMTRNGDLYRILASQNATTINVNGGANINLNAGQYHEVTLTPGSFITSNKPISVAQYSRGTSCDGVTSDPFMIMLSPVEQFMDYIVFQAFNTTNINQFYTNIITKTANTGLVRLDGAVVPGWTAIPSNPTYSYARRNIAQGSHILNSDSGLVATVYGFGDVESYGYLAGANVIPLNVGFAIIVDGDTIDYDVFHDTLNCNQQTVTFITDPTANITDISWDFGDGTTGINSPITHSYTSAGDYTVTLYFQRIGSCVLDSLELQVVVSNDLPPLQFPNDTVFCDNNASLQIDVTTPGVTYLWNDNSTNPTYTITSPGTYSVTVTDQFNCSVSATVDVDYVNLTASATSTDVTCMGMDDGTANVTPSGGYLPYTFSWNTNPVSTTQTITNLPAGTYMVTVTEDNGCTATAEVTITESGLLDIISDSSGVSCFGLSDGSASVSVSGGASPYTYEWNTTPIQYTAGITDIVAGTYTVTITDDNGCAASVNITVPTPTQVVADIPTISPASCTGTLGQMNASASGGTPPYTYAWSTTPSQTGITATGLAAGTYTVTITDDNGCTGTSSAEYTTITLSFSTEPEYCDQQNGSATVSVDDYTGTYSIQWNTGATTGNIQTLSAGSYTVTVTDDNGSCTMSVNIQEINGPMASFTMDPNPATVGDDQVNFYNQSIGGNSWLWDFGDYSASNLENPNHMYYTSGTYTVWLIVTDEHNCTDTTSNIITIQDMFTFYVPTAFSPNGDGINDVFMPYGMNIQSDNYNMSIYDRWGRLIFETTSVNTPWDGKVNGSDELLHKIDVYTYKIGFRDSKGLDREIIGRVTLVF